MKIHQPGVVLEEYAVDKKHRLVLRVIVGDAQGGGWSARLGGRTWKGGDEAVDLGAAADVKGKVLQVAVVVKDVRPETNRLGSVVTLSGGAQTKKIPQGIPDAQCEDGNLAIFTTVVFVK